MTEPMVASSANAATSIKADDGQELAPPSARQMPVKLTQARPGANVHIFHVGPRIAP